MLFQLSPRTQESRPPRPLPLSPLLSLSQCLSLSLQLCIGHAISSIGAVHKLDLSTKTFFFFPHQLVELDLRLAQSNSRVTIQPFAKNIIQTVIILGK